jgi:hypothetical protein
MSSFSNRDRQPKASEDVKLSEASMPSGHKPSWILQVADFFNKDKRDEKYLRSKLGEIQTKEVALSESIASLGEQLKTLNDKLQKKEEELQTLPRDTPAWENCLADIGLDLDEEESLNKTIGALREKVSNARRYMRKIEEVLVVGGKLIEDPDRLLDTLEEKTADLEFTRREESKYAERMQRLGTRGGTKTKAVALDTYERLRARRGEKNGEEDAKVVSLQAMRARRRQAE